MATINSVDLGVVKIETSSKESNLFFQSLPYSDSTDAILLDLMGTQRTITLTGKFIESSIETLKSKIEAIESIQNGNQSVVVYAGSLITKNVEIQNFSWDYNEGSPNTVDYTLTLLEGR